MGSLKAWFATSVITWRNMLQHQLFKPLSMIFAMISDADKTLGYKNLFYHVCSRDVQDANHFLRAIAPNTSDVGNSMYLFIWNHLDT